MPIAAQTKHTRAAIFLTENSIEIERKPDGFIVRFGKEPTPGMLGPPPQCLGKYIRFSFVSEGLPKLQRYMHKEGLISIETAITSTKRDYEEAGFSVTVVEQGSQLPSFTKGGLISRPSITCPAP